MIRPTTRHERLRALRQQEHARALEQLGRAEVALSDIDGELDRLRRCIAELDAEHESPEPGTVAAAGALAAGSRGHQLGRERRARLESAERVHCGRREVARAAVDDARDRVAAAVRALRALDES